MTFTAAEKLKCAERELALRYRVYEMRVDAGKMSRHQADREIALMEDIAADYRAETDDKSEAARLRAALLALVRACEHAGGPLAVDPSIANAKLLLPEYEVHP